MVKVSYSDVSDKELLDYMSEDSDNGDESLLNKKYAEKEALITLETKFPKIVTILGIPIVEAEKHGKLAEVLKKLFIKHLSTKISDASVLNLKIDMPTDEQNKTKGICFVTFHDSFQANEAVKILNKLKLDAKHVLRTCKMDDIENILNRDEQVMPIKVVGFTREKLRWWINDDKCREQFIVRYGSHFEVNWFDPLEKEPELIYTTVSKNAPFYCVQWSVQGSYLVSFHNPGIALWGGENFDKLIRLQHKNVKAVSFSPIENYVLTWDGTPSSLRNEKAVCIWRVITGKLLRSFITPETLQKENNSPLFLWSPDDRYIACLGKIKELYVYELPSMLLIENEKQKRTPLKYSNIHEFDWSPVDNIISVWIPGVDDNIPGNLILVEIPSRKELVSRKLYDVSAATLHWQKKGDYLCLKTTICRKVGRKSKKELTQLEIFRIREKNIPVDNIQIEGVKAKQFHWEGTCGHRFALIVRDEMSNKQQIRFYRISNTGTARDVKWVTTFDINNQMNFMNWSPQGTQFILASLGSEGILYFCSLTANDEVEVIHKDEHQLVNQISWSHCGRYISTAVTATPSIGSNFREENNDAGFYIWTFQGKCLLRSKKPSFCQVLFRPHPKSLFSDKEKLIIKKNLKEFSKKFDTIDEKIKTAKKNSIIAERKKVEEEFNEKLEATAQLFQAFEEYEQYIKDWEAFESQFEWEEKTTVIEQVLSIKQEICT